MAALMRDAPPSDLGIVKAHEECGKSSWAIYSECMRYRYRLRRIWDDGSRVAFLMLNPSTASELRNDPTIERCERRAKMLGFSGFDIINLFAFRATNPKALYKTEDPVGARNDEAIISSLNSVDQLICAWGNHGALQNRDDEIKALLKPFPIPIYIFSLTQAGQPKHPLYISYAQAPIYWEIDSEL